MNYTSQITDGTKEQCEKILNELDLAYSEGNELISDQEYDTLSKIYENRFGKRNVIGAPATKNPIALPIAMMSLDKIMEEKQLKSFVSKNDGPYVVMDKINGQSGLYEVKNGRVKLYNRGNGTIGTDITYLLPYLNLPVLPFDIYVKGELVINKKDYEPFTDDYKTNLSMINGLINSQSADPARLKLFRFIAYDMVFPSNPEISLPMIQTLEYLVKYGFTIPFNVLSDVTIEYLNKLFDQQKTVQLYDVDGLVITSNRPISYHERLIRENPKWAVAFKKYGEEKKTTVVEVIWKPSKHEYLKPTVKVEPVTMEDGFTINSLTAFNAKWISDNKIGPGAELMVTHNTVPYITQVISGTEAQMPEGNWKWNDTQVDILLLEANDEVKIARIYEFFKQIGCKYWGETTISKFYYAGFNTIKIMVESTKQDFMRKEIEGIGEGIIDRMVRTRDEALPTVTLDVLMSASSVFGIGFGTRKISLILNEFPNLLEEGITLDQVRNINGFADKTAERFIEGLPKFKQFLMDIPVLNKIIKGEYQTVDKSSPKTLVQTKLSPVNKKDIRNKDIKNGETLKGKSVVFTGFRDANLERIVKQAGGDVKTGVSKKTNYLVVGGEKGIGSSKEKKANEFGIPVLNLMEFRQMFNL